ncbi:hypothetical protein ACFX2C_044135 [Malus domestica]
MSRSKRDGGIRFHNLKDFDLALFVKQCWHLIHDPDSLWARVLNERHKVRFWFDKWVLSIPAGHHTLPLNLNVNKEMMATKFIEPVSRGWNLALVSEVVLVKECNTIYIVFMLGRF